MLAAFNGHASIMDILHDPRQSPKEFVDMYPLENISIPDNFQPLYPYREEMGSGEDLRDEQLAPFPRTEYAVKVNRQEYYAIVTHMDKQIGIILDELEKSGKMVCWGNRTCVITVFVFRLLLQVRISPQTIK